MLSVTRKQSVLKGSRSDQLQYLYANHNHADNGHQWSWPVYEQNIIVEVQLVDKLE